MSEHMLMIVGVMTWIQGAQCREYSTVVAVVVAVAVVVVVVVGYSCRFIHQQQ